jgi:hypothetical protein
MHLYLDRASIKTFSLALVVFILVFTSTAHSQVQNLNYKIIRNGKEVGFLKMQQMQAGTKTTYSAESLVKIQMLIYITVHALEKSIYDNDVLQFSSVIRKVNGKEKLNKEIRNSGNGLKVNNNGKELQLKNYLVKYNMHSLYTKEPIYYTNVFSDNYQQFVPIKKLAEHQYKLEFPDGNSNEYFYNNGICSRMNVRSTLFDADFLLSSR